LPLISRRHDAADYYAAMAFGAASCRQRRRRATARYQMMRTPV